MSQTVDTIEGAYRVLGLFAQIGRLADRVRRSLYDRDCPTCSANAWRYHGISHGRMIFHCEGCGVRLQTDRAEEFLDATH